MERNPTHIAHIAKTPRANAETKALLKSAILPTHRNNKLWIKQILLFDFQLNNFNIHVRIKKIYDKMKVNENNFSVIAFN